MPVWTLAIKDLRLLARDTRAVVILLAMPLVFILVLGLALGESFGQKPDDRLRVSVVVLDEGLGEYSKGSFPGRPWSQVVLDDLGNTAGIRVERIDDRAIAERLVRRGERSAVLVFGPSFSRLVQRCSFLSDRFLKEPGVNPFYRDGIKLAELDVELLTDPTQATAASIIEQVVQVTLLRVIMPWMIGRAFDEVTRQLPLAAPVLKALFSKYDLTAKTWAQLTKEETRRRPQPRRRSLTDSGSVLHRDVRLLPCAHGGLALRGRAPAGYDAPPAGGAADPGADPARQAHPLLSTVVRPGSVFAGRRQDRVRHDLGTGPGLARGGGGSDVVRGGGPGHARRQHRSH
jgi:hypothetical protein